MTADLEGRIQAFENKCYRRMEGILYREHKQTHTYGNRSMSSPDVRSFFVNRRKLSWFGHVCRHDTLPMIIYKEKWVIVVIEEDQVNHERTTPRIGQASRCRHCCSSRITEVDGRSSQQMHLSEYTNDAWASRVLISWAT